MEMSMHQVASASPKNLTMGLRWKDVSRVLPKKDSGGNFTRRGKRRGEEHHVNSKHLKYLVLVFISTALGIGTLLWGPFATGYYHSFAITYDKYNSPFITAELQSGSYVLTVDIGSRFPLLLRQEILDGIDKQPQGTDHIAQSSWTGARCSFLSYSKIKVGDLVLKNIIANPTSRKKALVF